MSLQYKKLFKDEEKVRSIKLAFDVVKKDEDYEPRSSERRFSRAKQELRNQKDASKPILPTFTRRKDSMKAWEVNHTNDIKSSAAEVRAEGNKYQAYHKENYIKIQAYEKEFIEYAEEIGAFDWQAGDLSQPVTAELKPPSQPEKIRPLPTIERLDTIHSLLDTDSPKHTHSRLQRFNSLPMLDVSVVSESEESKTTE